MTLDEQIQHQRIKHIISSYQLDENAAEACANYLTDLVQLYPTGWIELAIVETIVANWAHIPMTKGVAFFDQVKSVLTGWQSSALAVSIRPEEFQQITGLDPNPAFGSPPLNSSVSSR